MATKIKSCLVILVLLASIPPITGGGAVGADDFLNFHVLYPVQVTYTNSSGSELCKKYKGFGYAYNMYDTIAKCRKEAEDCVITMFTVAKSVNNPTHKSYKVFIPPGTSAINIRILKPNNQLAGAVVRYGLPPVGSYRNIGHLGAGEKVTLGGAKSADRFAIGNQGRGQVYILKQSPVTGEEVGPDGGWLYFKIFASIQQLSVSNNVNYQAYMDWVQSWLCTPPKCGSIPCDPETCKIDIPVDVCPDVTIAKGKYIIGSKLSIHKGNLICSGTDFPTLFSSKFGETGGDASNACP